MLKIIVATAAILLPGAALAEDWGKFYAEVYGGASVGTDTSYNGIDYAMDPTWTAGAAFGVALPQTACRAATAGNRSALWLGPDEWLLLAEDGATDAIEAAFAEGMAGHPHSLVDVGHRNTAIEIAGPAAADVLNAGCPLDLRLDAFPVGMCTRTVFAKAEIVLWRLDDQRFRVEVWRSFAGYLWGLLDEIRREHAA